MAQDEAMHLVEPAGAEQEREIAEAQRRRDVFEAKILHDLKHPRPKSVIRLMSWHCSGVMEDLQRNLRHRSKRVRAAAEQEVRTLLAELGKLMDSARDLT